MVRTITEQDHRSIVHYDNIIDVFYHLPISNYLKLTYCSSEWQFGPYFPFLHIIDIIAQLKEPHHGQHVLTAFRGESNWVQIRRNWSQRTGKLDERPGGTCLPRRVSSWMLAFFASVFECAYFSLILFDFVDGSWSAPVSLRQHILYSMYRLQHHWWSIPVKLPKASLKQIWQGVRGNSRLW